MADESLELMKTLYGIVNAILAESDEGRRRMAEIYAQAQEHVATIPLEARSARRRIVVCYQHWDMFRLRNDVAGSGWVLTAIQQRIGEKDLPDWPKMQSLVERAVAMLEGPRGPTWDRPKRRVH